MNRLKNIYIKKGHSGVTVLSKFWVNRLWQKPAPREFEHSWFTGLMKKKIKSKQNKTSKQRNWTNRFGEKKQRVIFGLTQVPWYLKFDQVRIFDKCKYTMFLSTYDHLSSCKIWDKFKKLFWPFCPNLSLLLMLKITSLCILLGLLCNDTYNLISSFMFSVYIKKI